MWFGSAKDRVGSAKNRGGSAKNQGGSAKNRGGSAKKPSGLRESWWELLSQILHKQSPTNDRLVLIYRDKPRTRAYGTDSRLAGGSAPRPLAASQQ